MRDGLSRGDLSRGNDSRLTENRRGVLYPQRLPEFHRLTPDSDLQHAVRWFWIPEWNLPPGIESTQEILPFPACNLVIEPEGITAVGPPTRISQRVLTDAGWAVGALIRAAAAPALIGDPASLRDHSRSVEDPRLLTEVTQVMGDTELPAETRRANAVTLFSNWLRARLPEPAAEGEIALANQLEALLSNPRITRVDQLPELLHISPRSLQRLADRHFGLSLHSMIRRRRLQEGAERLRAQPEQSIAALAGDLGYSDHAHFTRDFKRVLGVSPSEYRDAQ